MSAVNHFWENPMINRAPSRDELIEDRVRHIIPQLERAERLGRHEYVKLSPVDATVLAIVLKEKVAELTMKRYATDVEETTLRQAMQPQVFAYGGGGSGGMGMAISGGNAAQNTANYQKALAAQQAAHMKAHQQVLSIMEREKAAPKKRKLFNW
jgi:hypothetical protein